jgi:predicted ester cyclase
MSERENREFITRYGAALSGNPKPAAIVDQYVADEELKHHIEVFEAAFPSYEFLIDDMLAEGDKVCLRGTFRGVHQHDFMGIPASGKQASISLMIIYRIEGGKIVEHWLNADSLSLMQQLGGVPVAV